ncbi:GNAT family N-acetyltransferase [Streptomyces sp. NPDC097619]|uniref:GNAT family N-acetyltransferase n=1 Tax=Streptomyces sp. NPDC097619 TaxID=3157228 RepID=UPI0033294128
MDDLVTERLVLHPLDAAEAERLLDPRPRDRAAWAPGYPDETDAVGARTFLATIAETGDPHPFGAYEIRRRSDGLAIGGLGFHGPADAEGGVTIGYGLIPSARGAGYATEAVRALLDLARRHGARRVRGDTDRENVASQRVMTAAGLRLVAEDDRLRYYELSWVHPEEGAVSGPVEGPPARAAS